MSSSPSAALFGGQTYCLHQGEGNNGQLWYRAFDLISHGQFETYESIWRNPALKQLGYAQGHDGYLEFADHLCQKYNTTRAYIAFFTKFPQAHFAYANRVRICMQYYNDSWGPENIYKVFTHESCHIFQAADEYGSCTCGQSGVYDVNNRNCKNCTSDQVACVMDANTLTLCTYTQGQVGWLPRSGLFAFYQGFRNNGSLWYGIFDGQSWWASRRVPNPDMSSRPSAVQFNGKI